MHYSRVAASLAVALSVLLISACDEDGSRTIFDYGPLFRGTVTDSLTMEKLQGVTVLLRLTSSLEPDSVVYAPAAVTDSLGEFAFGLVGEIPDSTALLFSRAGYVSKSLIAQEVGSFIPPAEWRLEVLLVPE